MSIANRPFVISAANLSAAPEASKLACSWKSSNNRSFTQTAIFPAPHVKNYKELLKQNSNHNRVYNIPCLLLCMHPQSPIYHATNDFLIVSAANKTWDVDCAHSWTYLQPRDSSEALENAGFNSTTPNSAHSLRSESEYR